MQIVAGPDCLSRINDCLVNLGPDYQENVDRITSLCGELLGSTCALYNRLDGNDLSAVGRWQAPPDLRTTDRADGHICFDVIREASRVPVLIRDLASSRYAVSDSNIVTYGLRTYAGVAVVRGGRGVGALCAVYQKDVQLDDGALQVLSILGAALGTEETRREAVESLRDSEEKFRASFDMARDPIFWAQADTGIIVNCNRAAEELLGRPKETVIGRPQTGLHPTEEKGRYVQHFRRDASAEEGASSEAEVLSSSGRHIPVWISASHIRIGGQDLVQGIFRDISERKRMERSLRTMRQQKLESLGTLAGGIAHDFNNMLTGILANISLLRERGGRAGRADVLLREAEDACMNAKKLARQLLTFSSGGMPMLEVLDVGPILKQSLRFATRGSNVRVLMKEKGGPFFSLVDEGQFAQVVQNLALNAVQAMPDGGTLSSEIRAVSLNAKDSAPLPAGRFLRISMRDTGPGIPETHLSRLFEPYFSTKGTGRGLGLAVSHSIVAKHGGRLEVESPPGKGAVFSILLPATGSPRHGKAPKRPVAKAPKGRRILVMDDDRMVLQVLTRILASLGCAVEKAPNGESALRAWREARRKGRPFAAAILDLTVSGGMGGKETVKKLREMDPDARAIVTSGYSTDPILSDYGAYGFYGALSKPFRFEDVSAALDSALGAAPAGEAGGSSRPSRKGRRRPPLAGNKPSRGTGPEA